MFWASVDTMVMSNDTFMIICAWCKKVEREGTLPASHSCCADCLAKIDADVDAITREFDDDGQRLANRDWDGVDLSPADCSPVLGSDPRD